MSNRVWLAVILAVYLVLGVAYSVVVPLGESPDELDHFHYARYLVRERAYPPLSADAAQNVTQEANQPPLYYLLVAAATVWVPMEEPLEPAQNMCFSFDPADTGRQTFYVHSAAEAFPYRDSYLAYHVARLISLLLGAGTVWLTHRLARQIVPDRPAVGLLAAMLLAFNPQFLFISASANNDVLIALLGAALVVLSIACWQRPSLKASLLLGVVTGLGLLAKYSFLALWPVALLAVSGPLWDYVAAIARRDSQASRPSLLAAVGPPLVMLGLPLLIAGWWYARNTMLYGDPLAWDVHLAAKGPQVLRQAPLSLPDLGEFVSLHFRSSWGLFGWLNVQLPGWVYGLALLLVVAAVAGLIWCGASAWRAHRRGEQPWCYLPGLGFTLLSIGLIYISLFRYILTINWSGYQGRLAYPAAGPIAAALAVGLAFIIDRVRKGSPRQVQAAYGLLGGFAFLLALGSLALVLPPAYDRDALYSSVPEAAGICARFDGGLLLEAVTTGPRVQPGQSLPVTLAGYGMAPASGSGELVVTVLGRESLVAGEATAPVSWSPGESVVASVDVSISPETLPARGIVTVQLRDAAGTWPGATSANGRALTLPLPLRTVKVAPVAMAQPLPEFPAEATFGDQLRLLGYDAAVSSGELVLTLYWQALRPMKEDLTTFVHLLDGDGRLLAQADGQPQGGDYPTSIWDAGEVVVDKKALVWPADAAGPWQLAVGVYRLPSGERLTLDGRDGTDVLTLAVCEEPATCQSEGQ